MLPEPGSACCPTPAGLAARFRRGQCNFHAVLNRLFCKLNRFICNYEPVCSDHWCRIDKYYTLTSSGWLLLNWVCFINSSKMTVLNRFFFKLNRFICNYEPVLSDHWCRKLDKCLYNNLHITTYFPRPNYLIQNSLFTTTLTLNNVWPFMNTITKKSLFWSMAFLLCFFKLWQKFVLYLSGLVCNLVV
jgi:hypothetical protein